MLVCPDEGCQIASCPLPTGKVAELGRNLRMVIVCERFAVCEVALDRLSVLQFAQELREVFRSPLWVHEEYVGTKGRMIPQERFERHLHQVIGRDRG